MSVNSTFKSDRDARIAIVAFAVIILFGIMAVANTNRAITSQMTHGIGSASR